MMVSSGDAPSEPGTREYILSVASRLFSERGFANVSIRDICEEAGVTPPTVYYYFGNKDKLFENVIRRTLSLKDFRATLVKVIEKQGDPKDKIKAFIRHHLSAFPRSFFNPGMFLQASTQLYGASTERVMSEFIAIREVAKGIIRDGIDSGAFRTVDKDQATDYLLTVLVAFILMEVHYYQTQDLEQSSSFITDMYLNGLSRIPQ